MNDTTPILYGIEMRRLDSRGREQRYCIVYCDQCGDLHMHGSDAEGGNGHRIAHCTNSTSRYRVGGYYVKIIPWTETEFRAVVKYAAKITAKKRRQKKGKRR